MPLDIAEPSRRLRVEAFPTRERDATTGIYVAYLNVPPDFRIDAAVLDEYDACSGHFGIAVHFVIRTDGTVERGRDIRRIAAMPRKWTTKQDHVAIGIVGGRDLGTYEIADTITPEQEAALKELLQHITDELQVSLEVDDRVTDRQVNADASHADRARSEHASLLSHGNRARAVRRLGPSPGVKQGGSIKPTTHRFVSNPRRDPSSAGNVIGSKIV